MSTGSPPSEYFPNINYNYSFWSSGKDFVTKEYVDNNFLKAVGYSYSRAISTSFSGIIYALGGIETTFIIATGDISANNFKGSGAQLTSLNASNISTGTLTVSRGGTGLDTLPLNQILIGNNTSSIFSTSLLRWDPTTDNLIGKFTGSGANITNLNADNFISGTLPINFGGTGANSFIANRLLIGGTTTITQSGNLTFDGTTNILTTSNIAGNGSRLTNLNASNVSDGTLGVARGGTGATTFTAGRLLIGNGASAITEDPELTWNVTTNVLTVTGTGAITTVNATTGNITTVNATTGNITTLSTTNIGIGITNPTTSSIEIVRPVTTATDIINMRYDATNGLRYQQAYVAANDVKYNVIQKNNNVDTNILTYYKGNIGIGTTAPAATDKLSVTGNTKITGTVTIDTNLVVGGSAGIVGTGQFSGLLTASEGLTIPINKTFTSNGHISANTLQTSGLITANTITSSGLLTANGGIQASTIKIGAGGLLKMATSTADMTQIGTTDSLLSVATCINLNGYTRATYPSCILYNCEQLGKHIFFTTNAGFTLERLRIENNGNVGIGTTDTTTYKLNVGGTLNTSGDIITTSTRSAIVGYQPTLYLRHTNSAYRSAMIHCNGNLLYFLGAPYGGTPTQDNWATVGSGQWPLTLNLTNNEANFGGNVNVQSLNNIGVSDFLRASQNVFFSKADYCRYETATAYSSYSYSQFTINANLLRSEYSRPQVQWRWFIGISTGDAGRVFSWGFWCVMYDQYYNSFSGTRLAGTGDIAVNQNWDGSGWNRLIITITNPNPAYQLNINIS